MHIKHFKAVLVGLALAAGVAWLQAAAPASPQGCITARTFLDIGSGTAVADLTGNAKFPDSPDIVEYPTYFEMYATGNDLVPPPADVYNNSGGQIVGYFYADFTGEFIFWIASDDASNLYLSTDSDPASKKLIAQETGYSGVRSWEAVGGGTSTVEAKNSSTFTGTEWPTKNASGGAFINLTAGQAYYIEAVFKEGIGDDNLSVSIDGGFPIPGAMLSSFDKASGPAAIVTPPASQTVEEGQPVTFTVEAAGTPPYTFQWKRNGANIGSPSTSPSYTIDRASREDNGARYSVTVTGGQGTATSAEATLTVNNDTTPPTLELARSSALFTNLTVTFSEPLDPATAQQIANYQISGGIAVLSATLAAPAGTEGDNRVVLMTSLQPEFTAFTLTVNNVKDVAGNTIAANSQIEFRSFLFASGNVFHYKYDGFDDGTGGNPDNLFNDTRYPYASDRTDLLTMFEYPPGGAGRVAADPTRNYFDTIEGYFVPPTTGNYVFFISGADRFWLYLSTDEDPANKHMIAAEPGGWTDARFWLTTHDTDPARHRSDQSEFNAWPNGPTISLTAGRKYYIEEVHHDPSWSGGDFFAATYKLASEPDPADGDAPRLTGNVIGAYLDPTGSSVDIAQPPVDTTQEEGRAAVFTVTATGVSVYGGGVSYQWQRQAPGGTTWEDIAGATSASYTTPILTLADSGALYRVICGVPAVAEPSAAATLTVVTDLTPPKLAGAGAVASRTGTTFDVGVSFDELLDSVSAGTMANYSLSAGTITGIKFYAGSPGVVLTASGLTVGNTYTVTVANVEDLAGNSMPSTAREFSVSGMKWGVVGGNRLALGNGVLTTAEDGFDVYSDGFGEWATYDEATFVYEEVTGDFDKVLRVEFQDASSQWARAGLIARDVTNFGVNENSQTNGLAGRYQKVHVNPVTTAMGTPGNNSWEGNQRLTTGAVTTTAGNGGTPLYPNAWCRLQRAGEVFTIFRSDDAVSWTQLGTATFNPPMPATLFVGPEYCPENGNITEGLRGVWLAKFRNYGNFGAVVIPTIGMSSAGVITYTGVLQSSTTVDGSFTPVAGATSPYTIPTTGAAMFYRTASQ